MHEKVHFATTQEAVRKDFVRDFVAGYEYDQDGGKVLKGGVPTLNVVGVRQDLPGD